MSTNLDVDFCIGGLLHGRGQGQCLGPLSVALQYWLALEYHWH